ncbi:hypothetical protein CHS0354_028300 [Potamilus streckersoni]|uniref:IRF tryptophan pentad repeat domain-containing protein n=1 Tax=Potamilus streckersoni TaxID=2493646 RepID=A0AAE0VJU3_9BIVA|nr:hypothetical protein CHS0354_028300 [Potamilus streckersoni]
MGIAAKHPFSNGRMPRTRMGKNEVMNKPRPVRPIERQPMKEWLCVLLNENAIPHQLSWLDKNKQEFRINWRHGSRHGWSMKDVELYKRWAIHTGRFDENNQDTKRWKANFRCALNSLSDVKEQKDSGVKKGANAFKVYKFTDLAKYSRASRKRCKHAASDDETESKKLKPSSQSSEDIAFNPGCSLPSYDSAISSPSTLSMASSPMSPPSTTSTLHTTRPNANLTTVEFGKMISIPLHHCGFVMLKPSDLADTNQRQRETFDTGKVNLTLIVKGDYTLKTLSMFDDEFDPQS